MKLWNMAALVLGIAASSAAARADDVADHLAEAEYAGWQMATEILGPMLVTTPEQAKDFPGLAAFVAEIDATRDALKFQGDPKTFPGIDSDKLATRNPVFWRANYDVAPGDPAWMILHAGLLLAGGEAVRAQSLLVLAKSQPGVPEVFATAIDHLLGHCGHVIHEGNAAVQAGIKKFDAGDRPGAMADYDAALKAWPQCGWAFYERGFTRMADRLDAMKQAGANRDTFEIHTPEITSDFAESRRHNPFMINAYQGKAPNVRERILAIIAAEKGIKAVRDKGAKNPAGADELILLSNQFQKAEQDELALVVRQMAVIRRGGFRPADHPFLTRSLQRLALGPITDDVLARLAGPAMVLRRLVEPEADK